MGLTIKFRMLGGIGCATTANPLLVVQVILGLVSLLRSLDFWLGTVRLAPLGTTPSAITRKTIFSTGISAKKRTL
jgi:hypothetical protein